MKIFNLLLILALFIQFSIFSGSKETKSLGTNKSLLEVNDQKIIDEVNENLEKFKLTYEKLINTLNKSFKDENLSEKEIKNQKKELAEDILCNLQKEVVYVDKVNSPFFYINEIKNFINKLSYNCTTVKKMISRLTKKSKQPVEHEFINNLSSILKDLEEKVSQLKNLRIYMNFHKGYLDFAHIISTSNSIYQEEIKIVETDKEGAISEKLKKVARKQYNEKKENRSVISSLLTVDLECPLNDYVIKIGSKINEIQKNIKNKNNSVYLLLIENATKLKDKLEKIKQTISVDQEYFAERRSRVPNYSTHYVYRMC